MDNSLELFEEKFQRAEQASERRALDEHQSLRGDPVDPLREPRKRHKKPAISVSRFGKQESQGVEGLRSLPPSPLSAAASKSTFYHSLANVSYDHLQRDPRDASLQPRSVESFVSGVSEEETQHTDEQHEIQVERIAGRQTLPQTVGALLPRRLTRAQSHIDYSSINRSMVIDVSVETTTESHLPPNLATAYATRPSRSRAATVGHGGLVSRAKDFARKLRQKSRTDLP